MTKNTDPIADAEHEAAESENLVEALEERVRTGDNTVTPEQLEQQRGLSRFARLRVEAARRKAEKARQKQRQGQLDALVAEIDGCADDTARIVELRNTTEQALEAFAQACDDRNQWVRHTANRMRQLDVPDSFRNPDRDPSGLSWSSGTGGAHVATANRSLGPIKTGGHVADIVTQVAMRHGDLPVGGQRFSGLLRNLATPARVLENGHG